ncbi:M48 family metalloprotease [Streptomyces cavernicola]|uniref:M48 family metalloprotease n=1 Tax=Streptomyces cavernicola TaxID=3043613 RepID=A0ABT6SJZ6_9ACTN|nr:M48 family metalloprotease [Streptomyces sp. B-S-A6]MDI3408528.1 M48 family metalloprotease [Streptomyces sp. B-S-A6]
MSVPHAPEEPEKPSPQKGEAQQRKASPKKGAPPGKRAPSREAASKEAVSAPTFKGLSSIPPPRVPSDGKTPPPSLDEKSAEDPLGPELARAVREAQSLQDLLDAWPTGTPTADRPRRTRRDTPTPHPPTTPPEPEPAHARNDPHNPQHPHDPRNSRDPHTPQDGTDHTHHPGRVHLAAPRRGLDATALGRLALHVPQLLVSLALVGVAARFVDGFGGPPWWLPLGVWALSGALVRHRACENALARRLFGLRLPTPGETRALQHAWREVAARAGVNPRAYQLWVEESGDVNASVAVGRTVTVTSRALELPAARLSAVLAHELGHHVRGHTRAALLIRWYALPARLLRHPMRQLAERLKGPTWSARLLIGALAAIVLTLLATATYGLVLLPFVTPYLTAAVSRRAELRADEHAASLGFAEQLSAVLHEETRPHPHQQLRKSDSAYEKRAGGKKAERKKAVRARLLDPHPDPHTRLHHLHHRQAGTPSHAP